jgi:DNA mismatch repair protein MutS
VDEAVIASGNGRAPARRRDLAQPGQAPSGPMPPPLRFTSLLVPAGASTARQDDSFASDLLLDQIVGAIAGKREEHELITKLLFGQLRDVESIRYRQHVYRDLEDPRLFEHLQHFSDSLAQVRAHFRQIEKMQYQHQREGWFLDAADLYCDPVRALADVLATARLGSEALLAFRHFLSEYVASDAFSALAADTRQRKEALGRIRYSVRIRGLRVEVSRYEGEGDYSDEVLETFERFKQGAVKDYRVKYRTWPGMNHVGAQILDLVARLFSAEFSALGEFYRQHATFFDKTVRRFERELHVYLAYLDYIRPLQAAGLSFCYPDVDRASKEVFATDTFDLALANKLVSDGEPVVVNDFRLAGPERIFVVSGPNQGGKTTFARTFGQLHHLASVGCPVPGRTARLFLFDRLFVHFEREEDLTRMSGKLEDDLVRIREVLQTASPDSVIVMNEIFTSTTLQDAIFLGTKVIEKVIQLDLLCVYVTFVDELASLGESVVSMVSTIVPDNPAERTYKVVRGPADGLAFALAIAEKHRVTFEQLERRLAS